MDCNSHFISDVCIANDVLVHSPTFENKSDGTDILSYMFSKGCSAENNDFPAICTVRPYIFKWFTEQYQTSPMKRNPKGTFVVKSKLGSLYSVFTPFSPFELNICSS